jgi:CDGSH-type Zn-finger protein
MMEKPIIAQKHSYKLDMEPGTYYWCACGRSKNQPFCDGSHKGTSFLPMKVEIEEARKVAWCGCKHSDKKPFCDGKHRSL